jgi:general secretion pathway protein K
MKRPSVPPGERGAALLAVLLLVAVTGAIAAAALEKMSLSRAIATNIVALEQARAHANGIEQLAMLTIDDRIVNDPEKTTLAGGWNGAVRRVALPRDGVAFVRVQDGGNCFNVNSVVEGDPRTRLTRRNSGVAELAGLMQVLQGAGRPRRAGSPRPPADWAGQRQRPRTGRRRGFGLCGRSGTLSNRQHPVRRSRRACRARRA